MTTTSRPTPRCEHDTQHGREPRSPDDSATRWTSRVAPLLAATRTTSTATTLFIRDTTATLPSPVLHTSALRSSRLTMLSRLSRQQGAVKSQRFPVSLARRSISRWACASATALKTCQGKLPGGTAHRNARVRAHEQARNQSHSYTADYFYRSPRGSSSCLSLFASCAFEPSSYIALTISRSSHVSATLLSTTSSSERPSGARERVRDCGASVTRISSAESGPPYAREMPVLRKRRARISTLASCNSRKILTQ